MKVLSLVFLILGCFLGAGVVSGKEVATYFSVFGANSVWEILVATLLFFVLIYFFLMVSNRVSSFASFVNLYFGKLSKCITILFSLCLLIIISSMFAGSRELSVSLNMNKWILMLMTAILCFIIVIKNVKGLSTINLIFIPIILIVIVFNCTSINFTLPNTMQNLIYPLFSGVNYVFINIVTLGFFILEIGKNFTKKQKMIASIIASLIVGMFLFLINNSICNNNLQNFSMPMLSLSLSKNIYLWIFTSISIWIGLFTTLISCVFVLSNYFDLYLKNRFLSVGITIILGLVVSFFGFNILVGYVYWIIGGVGLVIVVKMLFKEKEIQKLNSKYRE